MSRPIRDVFHTLPPNARILLVRLRSMGDCLLLTSPLRALKEEFPGFRVSVLVDPGFSACFDLNPDVDEILVTSKEKYQTVGRLLVRRFHTIINLHGGPTSLSYSCAAWGRRVGVEGYQYGRLYSALIPQPPATLHTVDATMELFRYLGLRAEAPPALHYAPHPEEAKWARETLRDRPYVVIHPATRMETKRWSAAGFASVGNLLSEAGWHTVLTAGPGEESVVGEIARDLPDSVILFGLTIPRLAELIRGARVYIGNDSGPMHLAAAVGTPTLAVWGSSDSKRWRPWRVAHRVVQNPFDCNPCAGYQCDVAETPLCIESVTTRQVEESIQLLLQETGAKTPALAMH